MGKVEWVCVQCCKCSTFQVERRKKSKKYSCKICGKKQSFVKIFATSNQAKDIRKVVQEYNSRRFDPEFQNELNESKKVKSSNKIERKENSKWNSFGSYTEESEERTRVNRDVVTNDEEGEKRLRKVGKDGKIKRTKKKKKKKKEQRKRKRELDYDNDENEREFVPTMKKRKLDNNYDRNSDRERGNQNLNKKEKQFKEEEEKIVSKDTKWGSFL